MYVRVRDDVVAIDPANNLPRALHKGQAFPADDPLVRARPELFEGDALEQDEERRNGRRSR